MGEARFPHPIRTIENEFIPLADGTRLAARIWLPRDAEEHPVPAILEYLPYRKRDFMRTRDEPMHRYYAAHGYAAIRVDLRGTGDSGGLFEDEYTPREQSDAVEVIDWLTRQQWCDGNVGMTGISWGGFNALQVAAHAPAALKAIITLCASDDRYADDAHYMGGCLLNENQIWGTVLFALSALPPDPEIVGADRWKEVWMARLEAVRPFPAVWLEHQRRDSYWEQGSVCEDYARIECPVYAIGGWADGYSNAVPRLLAGLRVPRKGLIGPWAHTFPHNGVPGPAIGYLQEALRWWDRWLKGRQNGIEDEPLLRVWMQHGVEPEPFISERPGRWVAEAQWPSERIQQRQWALCAGTTDSGTLVPLDAADDVALDDPVVLSSSQSTGLTAGTWCEFGSEGEAPRDQRQDDGHSLTFDTGPLEQPLEILGAPEVHLRVAVDRPVAVIAVRLNEVFPSGASARVTYGVLNLTHRESHRDPSPLVPGEPVDVVVRLNDIAHRFQPQSSVRVAISTAYWPTIWPPPQPVTLTLYGGPSRLALPLRPDDPGDAALQPFEEPDSASSTSHQRSLAPMRYTRTIQRDLISDRVTYRMVSDGGDLDTGSIARIEAIDLDLGHWVERTFEIDDSDPLAAATAVHERMMLRREQWNIMVDTRIETTATASEFHVVAKLDATENGAPVFSRSWHERIPRDLV